MLAGLTGLAMALTAITLHPAGYRVFTAGPHSLWHLFDVTETSLQVGMLLMPAVAGLLIGAPLVAREIETGTTRFAWAQGAGRARQLIAAAVPIALLVTAVAIGVGIEFRWWAAPLLGLGWAWEPILFRLNPLPLAGWSVLGFCLGVFLGAVIRRTVPAMAATFGCVALLLWCQVTFHWRLSYLAPLRRAAPKPSFSPGGGYGWSLYWGSHGARPEILGTALGWPDGRLLTRAELHHSASWFRLHHIQVWVTYQPGSRLSLFQYIEFGWLVALSALLVAATIIVIRRRPA